MGVGAAGADEDGVDFGVVVEVKGEGVAEGYDFLGLFLLYVV